MLLVISNISVALVLAVVVVAEEAMLRPLCGRLLVRTAFVLAASAKSLGKEGR